MILISNARTRKRNVLIYSSIVALTIWLTFHFGYFEKIKLRFVKKVHQNHTELQSMESDLDAAQLELKNHEPELIRNSSVKTILLWTHFDESRMWWYGFRNDFGHEVFAKHGCKHTNCNLIYDRSRLAEADYLMFYHDDAPEWPEIRYSWQSYILILKERPGPWHWWLEDYDPKINITMSYRKDSDIQFYNNGFHKRNNPLKESYKPQLSLSSKKKSVVWMVSNCDAVSKRYEYAVELSRYIDVDIVGDCGTLSCPKTRTGSYNCLQRFEKKYKFYLSFENAVCDDYVTEKLYRPLEFELVPIVLGGANYTSAAPPHSVINVRDYSSPKQLAEYLHHLASHEEEYYAYFAWKQWYWLMSMQDCYCTLCDALNDPKVAYKKAGGVYDWWQSGCDNTMVDKMREAGNW